MYQRNFKNNKTISTYPCNTGYVTEMSDQYGRRIKEIFSYTIEEARQNHPLNSEQSLICRLMKTEWPVWKSFPLMLTMRVKC